MTRKHFKWLGLNYGLLFLITLVGAWLRFINLTPHKIYPDSYQNLLVAINLERYGSVVGFLGENGLVYPPFLIWTRFGFPLLINSLKTFGLNTVGAAEVINISASIISIPLIFFVFKFLFQSKQIALLGASLLAISFNHIAWSGFLQTEAVGVLTMLFFLLSIVTNLRLNAPWWHVYVTAFMLARALTTRYEYFLVLIPTAYLIFNHKDRSNFFFYQLFLATGLFLIIPFIIFFPWPDTFYVVQHQLSDLSLFTVAALVATAILIGIMIFFRRKLKFKNWPILLSVLVVFFSCYLTLQALMPSWFPYLAIQLGSLRDFFKYDFWLGILVAVGLVLLLNNQKYRYLAIFTLVALVCFWPVYYRINPQMQRYQTHLLPFYLIPASFALNQLISWLITKWQSKSKPGLAISGALTLLIMTGLQINTSAHGVKAWGQGEWVREGYEEQAAKKLATVIDDKEAILLVSLPEPYYLYSKMSTQSLAPEPPFIYIDDKLNDQTVYVVIDMGMVDLFPKFVKAVEPKLQEFKAAEYWVGEPYHFSDRTLNESHPVSIYKLKLAVLKNKLAAQKAKLQSISHSRP